MRFTTSIVSCFLLVSTVLGAALHQATIQRSTSDICVSLDLNLDILNHVFGRIDACVCLSTLDIFIDENPTVRAAVKKLGRNKVKQNLLNQINAHRNKKKCHYPPHGVPTPSNKCSAHSDPCGFTCNDGFVANTKRRTCDCPSPNIVYNGKCIPKPGKPGGGKGPQPSGRPRAPQPPHGGRH